MESFEGNSGVYEAYQKHDPLVETISRIKAERGERPSLKRFFGDLASRSNEEEHWYFIHFETPIQEENEYEFEKN